MPAPEASSARPLPAASQWVRRALDHGRRAVSALTDRPLTALAALAVAQWLAILAFALTVRHNGWLFYQGGDQIWPLTTGLAARRRRARADRHRLWLAVLGRADHALHRAELRRGDAGRDRAQRARARTARALGDPRPRQPGSRAVRSACSPPRVWVVAAVRRDSALRRATTTSATSSSSCRRRSG